ncbi:hypothetical protein GQ42DRAFT_163114, partial [Ramicandelaber brevisporus]
MNGLFNDDEFSDLDDSLFLDNDDTSNILGLSQNEIQQQQQLYQQFSSTRQEPRSSQPQTQPQQPRKRLRRQQPVIGLDDDDDIEDSAGAANSGYFGNRGTSNNVSKGGPILLDTDSEIELFDDDDDEEDNDDNGATSGGYRHSRMAKETSVVDLEAGWENVLSQVYPSLAQNSFHRSMIGRKAAAATGMQRNTGRLPANTATTAISAAPQPSICVISDNDDEAFGQYEELFDDDDDDNDDDDETSIAVVGENNPRGVLTNVGNLQIDSKGRFVTPDSPIIGYVDINVAKTTDVTYLGYFKQFDDQDVNQQADRMLNADVGTGGGYFGNNGGYNDYGGNDGGDNYGDNYDEDDDDPEGQYYSSDHNRGPSSARGARSRTNTRRAAGAGSSQRSNGKRWGGASQSRYRKSGAYSSSASASASSQSKRKAGGAASAATRRKASSTARPKATGAFNHYADEPFLDYDDGGGGGGNGGGGGSGGGSSNMGWETRGVMRF